jgi:hypothetical protein
MAEVVRMSARPPVRQQARPGVVALCARLRAIGAAESPDEAMMDLFAAAELDLLRALARTPAGTLQEAETKFGVMVHRAEAVDGVLSEDELDVLHSALADLERLRAMSVAA